MGTTITLRVKQKSFDARYFKDRTDFRKWLAGNNRTSQGIWLLLHRKGTGKAGLTHTEALEEALCFGWIDSQLYKVDDERYILRFTSRRPRSPWSEINKNTALRMIREKRMTRAGLAKIEEAKRNGWWAKAYRVKRKRTVPSDLRRIIQKDKSAWAFFQSLPPSHKNQYILWVEDAKREQTRKDRILKVLERLRNNLRPGIGN